MADDDLPPRPRRERPLRANREVEPESPPPAPPTPPTATTPPVGPPIVEFRSEDDMSERDDHVIVAFDGPTTQRRWTVALRIFLVIPHFFWLLLVGIAAFFATIAAWFAALFTARVPEGLARFLTNVVQYQARVIGCGGLLLSDQYPPFALESDYAINVTTNPGRLNRAAVFFRVFLMVPGQIVSTIVTAGAQAAAVVGWLLTLILGRLPTPLWEANAAVLRYYTRFYAFSLMLTAEQPGGLFGDKTGAAPAALADEPDLPTTPKISRLVLSKAGRRVVVLFIVLGVNFQAGSFGVAVTNAVKTSQAYRDLDASHDKLGLSAKAFGLEAQQCAISGGLTCLHEADARLADAFDQFASEVADISFPSTLDASTLISDAHDCADALREMSHAETEPAYTAAATRYQDALNRFDQDYGDFAYDVDYNS
jgi:hypothetical protein